MFDSDLDKAYRATEYWVAADSPICLMIGVENPAMRDLQQDHGVHCSTIITAHNPKSQQQSSLANQQAHRELTRALKEDGYTKVPATGQHPEGGWPAEEGWLVLGMEMPEASRLAKQFEQFAVVLIDARGMPYLQWFA